MAMLLPGTAEGIETAAAALRAGNVVGMPTETVYGLAGNAFDELALTRIFSAKERPTFDPLIVHVSQGLLDRAAPDLALLAQLEALGLVDASRLSDLAAETAEELMDSFWPGPLTLILPKQAKVPDLVTSGLPQVGVRMPRHPIAQALITAAGQPLAAPSANRFGRISPTCARHVQDELGERIDWVLDGGDCEIGLESTVVAIGDDGVPILLRPGGISREEIEELLEISVKTPDAAPTARLGPEAQASPGMLASHYAPRKPLYLLPVPCASPRFRDGLARIPTSGKIALLVTQGDPDAAARIVAAETRGAVTSRTLTRSGDAAEAARNLFAMLRALDDSDAEILISEPCPSSEGLWHAIADRLHRAKKSGTAPL